MDTSSGRWHEGSTHLSSSAPTRSVPSAPSSTRVGSRQCSTGRGAMSDRRRSHGMSEKSKYFTPEFFAFFSDLAKNTNKERFTKNNERDGTTEQEPSLRFIRDAGPLLQKISPHLVADARPFGGSLSRIYRDIRFSPDKRPYKTGVGIHFWHPKATGPGATSPGYHLHMDAVWS